MATIFLTGANRGIGLSLAQQLTARGDHVIAAVRSHSAELSATGATLVDLDATDGAQIAGLADALGDVSLDWALINAGILRRSSLDALNVDDIRAQFEVNALAPLRIVAAVRNKLASGSKIGLVTSRMGSMADNTSGGAYGYRMSKAALNAAGKSLAMDLQDDGVAVTLLHPGWVKTDMTGNTGNWGPDEAAAGLIARMDALTLQDTGSFWHADGNRLTW